MNKSSSYLSLKCYRILVAGVALMLASRLSTQGQSVSRTTTENSLPLSTINFNPLGFLQFGPIIQAEFKVTNRGYVTPHVRIPYLGILYHVINADDRSDQVKVSPIALGIGTGYKYFFPVNKGAWYTGGVAEYSFGSSEGNDGSEWKSKFSNIALMANGGFRWRSAESKHTVSVGGYIGFYSALKDEWWYTSSPGKIHDERSTTPMFMLELAFGLEKK